jgi:hypothetical protein
MVKLAPITIPTKPIGSNPRPTDLIERVAPKGAGEGRRSHCSSRSHIETSEEGPDRVRSNLERIGAGARETIDF